MQNAFIARMLKKAAEPEPEPVSDENIEMHDSALFDVVVDFYDGTRLRIPQEVWPPDWKAPLRRGSNRSQ
jgi:hypothetical protein